MNSKILNNYLDNKNFSQSLKLKLKEIDIIVDKTVKEHLKYFQSREDKRKKNQILRFIRLDKTKDKVKGLMNNNQKKKFNEEVFLKFKKILEYSQILAKKNNSELYFIYLPSYQRFSKFGIDGDLNQRDELISMVKSLNIKFIDIFTEIEKNELDYKSLFPFGLYGHYNIKGYDEISKIIYDKILEK
jgi:lysophospholipase L1-like esterase